MARKTIQYPCDYRNDEALRKERKSGNILVIVLLGLCLFALIALGVTTAVGIQNNSEWQFYVDFDDMPQPNFDFIPYPDFDDFVPEFDVEDDPIPHFPESLRPSHEPDESYTDNFALPFETSFTSIPDVVDAVYPAVVGVINYQEYTGYTGDQLVEWGSGSGFFITTDGYIVTNQHVIEDSTKLAVILSNGEELEARLVGYDISSDIAVLKVDIENATALPKGDSDSLRVGEYVLAIGNPLDSTELQGTVTLGIISAKARSMNIDGYTNDYLQTDAAINPGNSGGPLINMEGYVIGMNTAKSTTAGYDEYGNAIASEGIGFALPINDVMEIVDSLIRYGHVQRPGIGVTISTRDAEMAAQEQATPGVFIYSVIEGGPADKAGLMVNDVILKINGQVMEDQDAMIALIQQYKVGDVVVFTVLRGTQQLDISVTIGDMNQMP